MTRRRVWNGDAMRDHVSDQDLDPMTRNDARERAALQILAADCHMTPDL
jgi:hypothetical protein